MYCEIFFLFLKKFQKKIKKFWQNYFAKIFKKIVKKQTFIFWWICKQEIIIQCISKGTLKLIVIIVLISIIFIFPSYLATYWWELYLGIYYYRFILSVWNISDVIAGDSFAVCLLFNNFYSINSFPRTFLIKLTF